MSSFKDEFNEKKKMIGDEIEEKKKMINDEIEETKESIQKTYNSGVTKTKKLFRRLFLFALLGLLLAGIGYVVYANWTYSTGTRTGVLIKISKKGYVFKTYEGQLNLGGFQTDNTTGMIGNIWNFSLKDEELYKKLGTMEGKNVTLTYDEVNKALPWQGDTNYFIIGAEEK